jgi:nitroreductase
MNIGTIKDFEILDAIKDRRSIRAFSDQPVEQEKIKALFEAARWAPSTMNEQPWQYIYATREDEGFYHLIGETLMPGNRVWALKAPLLIVSLARKTFLDNGSHNGSALHDTGMANFALSLQATEMGLYTHMMGGFDHNLLRKNLNIPEDLQPVVVIAAGYPGDSNGLPENLRQREFNMRSRKKLGEFVSRQPLDT